MKKLLSLTMLTILFYILTLTSCGQTGVLYLQEINEVSSGSSIVNSNSSIASGSTQKVDDDPSKPDRSSDPHANELVDSADNFDFDKDILNSSNAGGTPS
jgi:predicted small lipoprotein YifL